MIVSTYKNEDTMWRHGIFAFSNSVSSEESKEKLKNKERSNRGRKKTTKIKC